MQSGNKRGPERLEGGYEVMKKNEYLLMLFQDNETESEPKKELHAAVLECTVEALSQVSDSFDVDGKIGLNELFTEIEKAAKSGKANCVSPFRASELIAKKLGAEYIRPIDKLIATFCGASETPKVNLEDFL